MIGIINLRGHVVPVLSLRSKFGMDVIEPTHDSGVIVTELVIDERTFVMGLLTDTVQEVIDIPSNQIEPTPYTGSTVDTDFIQGMGKVDKNFIILLKLEKVLNVNELKEVTKSSKME
jgi:purine-binding chemotaxis protein CheW